MPCFALILSAVQACGLESPFAATPPEDLPKSPGPPTQWKPPGKHRQAYYQKIMDEYQKAREAQNAVEHVVSCTLRVVFMSVTHDQ